MPKPCERMAYELSWKQELGIEPVTFVGGCTSVIESREGSSPPSQLRTQEGSRSTPRARVRYEAHYKHMTELAPPSRRKRRKETKMATENPKDTALRGRTLWAAYYEGKSATLRASATAPYPTIRQQLIDYLGYNPGEIQLVQAGGLGQYYDEADKQCEVDIDLLKDEEEKDGVVE